MSELAKAIIAVMNEVDSIKKNTTVGTGNNSYKGVSDMDVKNTIGKAMKKHGLAIIPISVEPTMSIERWTEDTQYGPKTKQSVFTEVKTKYLILHESGESQEIVGYGHGTDSQDKSAGKATTYALKYALLYTFMVPTGDIDDADNDHSDERPTPPAARPTSRARSANQQPQSQSNPPQERQQLGTVQAQKPQDQGSDEAPRKVSLNIGDENWSTVLKYVISNKDKGLDAIIKRLATKYDANDLNKKEVTDAFRDATK
jgi:hypothetical protein